MLSFKVSTIGFTRSATFAGLACLVLSAAIRPAAAAEAAELTLYSAQHPQMVDLLTQSFTKQTGISVRVHSGEAPEIANQIVQRAHDRRPTFISRRIRRS